MTVAALILAPTPDAALADADGLPRVRREVDAAWAGGATPVVVMATDPDGSIAAVLAGTSSILAEPAPPPAGLAGQLARGLEVAVETIVETEAALLWPAAMGWVDPETVTSLIEAHGIDREALLRPTYGDEPGWPLVVPLAFLEAVRAVASERTAEELIEALVAGGARLRPVELGDPGTVIDGATPRPALPDYQGPPEPPAEHTHEWGAAVADEPEDAGEPPRRIAFEAGD